MTGNELRKRRARMGLTQAQLAAHLGVDPNTVARWERGELPIRPIVRNLMQYLDAEIVAGSPAEPA